MADGGMFGGGLGGPGQFPGYANAPFPAFNIAQAFGVQGPTGQMLNMALEGILPKLFGGNMQFAQFYPQVNLYDQLKRNSQFRMQQEAMSFGAGLDTNTYRQVLQGIANMTGTPFGARERAAADTMSKDMATLMPFLANMAPDLVDRMHGTRGSATIMAMRMADASRFMTDPATGNIGLSKNRLEMMTKDVFNNLFGEKADLGAMRGITAGQAGGMFDEMVRRGLMGGGNKTVSEIVGQQNAAMDKNKLAGPRLTAAEFANLPDFDRRMQEFESNRITDKLKGMSAAVSAMKDIFGENGRTDAPMGELINALQAITQNNLGSMDPANVERLVRNASNAAKVAGMSMDGMMALMAQTGSVTDRFGLNRAFAPGIATNASVFGAAYGNMFGGNRGFGGMDKDKAMSLDTRLQASAANSQQAHALAALMRLDEAGAIPDTPQGRQLKQYIKDLQSGDPSVPVKTPAELSAMVSGAMGGQGAATFNRFMRQTDANQQTIAKYDIGTIVRQGGQPRDAALRVQQAFTAGMAGVKGLSGNVAAQSSVANIIQERLLNLTEDELKQYDNGDTSFLLADVQKELKARGINISDAEVNTMLSLGRGNLETIAKRKGFDTGGNYLTSVNKRLLGQAAMNRQLVNAESAMQSEFSKLGRSKPMQRFVDAIMGQTDIGGDANKFLRDIFNGVSQDQIDAALAKGLGGDLDTLREMNKRDARGDAASLKELLQDPVANKDKIAAIAKAYGTTVSNLTQLRGKSEEQIANFFKVRMAGVRGQIAKKLPEKLKGLNIATSGISDEIIQGAIDAVDSNSEDAGQKARGLAEVLEMDEGAGSMMTKGTKDRVVGGLTTAGKLLESLQKTAEDEAKIKAMDPNKFIEAKDKMGRAYLDALKNIQEKEKVDANIKALTEKTKLTEGELRAGIGHGVLDAAAQATLQPLIAAREAAEAKVRNAKDPKEKEAAEKELADAKAAIRGHAQEHGYNANSVLDPKNFKGLEVGVQKEAHQAFKERGQITDKMQEDAAKIMDIAKEYGVSAAALLNDPAMAKKLKEAYGINVSQMSKYFREINAGGNVVVSEAEKKKIKEEIERRKQIEAKPGEELGKLLKGVKGMEKFGGFTKEALEEFNKQDPAAKAEFSKAVTDLEKLKKAGISPADIAKMTDADIAAKDPETKRLIESVRGSGLMKKVLDKAAKGDQITKDDVSGAGAEMAKKKEKELLAKKEKDASVVRLHSDTKFRGTLDFKDGGMNLVINPGEARNG